MKNVDISSLLKHLEEAYVDLKSAKDRIEAIFNSSLQGFFTFGKALLIEPGYSSRVEEFIGANIIGKKVYEVLALNRETFESFAKLVFDKRNWHALKQFSTMEAKLDTRILRVEFVPIAEEGQILRILATLTDVTRVKLLEERTERSARDGATVVRVLQAKPVFMNIMRSIQEVRFDGMNDLSARRYIHTLKGEFSFFGFKEIVEILQNWENKWQENYNPADLKKIQTEVLTGLSEFIDKYKKVLNLSDNSQKEILVELSKIGRLVDVAEQNHTRESLVAHIEHLVEGTLEEHLSWLGETWLMVAGSLGKKVQPVIWKESVPIFSEPYKKLFSTLVHVVRNAADHGIESPEERVEKGKPEYGRFSIELKLEGAVYHLRMCDDGKGIDLEKVRKRAQSLNLQVPENDQALASMVFEAALTTKESASEFSGQGIGLNAVREEARALGGGAEALILPNGGTEIHIWFNKVDFLKTLK